MKGTQLIPAVVAYVRPTIVHTGVGVLICRSSKCPVGHVRRILPPNGIAFEVLIYHTCVTSRYS